MTDYKTNDYMTLFEGAGGISMHLQAITKGQLFLSFRAIDNLIAITPDEIWGQKRGGYVYWQQIVHAITGSLFWLRLANTPFNEPYAELNIYPELEKDPENALTKQQVKDLLHELTGLAENFFGYVDDDTLLAKSFIYDKVTNLEVVFGQIRHLQYHIGHCEAILRDSGIKEIEWVDYSET
jgi:hypothetical protein